MAPLRNNRASNRANRGQIDHDIMEGLPVRQWRKQTALVNKTPIKDAAIVEHDPNDRWKELPMPRGSELYPPHSQALLRAARMGQFSKPQRPVEDEKDAGDEEDAEGEVDMGYVATKWAPVPKDQEQPEPEFLAKRRKGLPSLHEDVVGPGGVAVQMRKVKVKKVDANGIATIFDVLAPEGVVVEGEIVEGDSIMTEAPAPGTVVEGVGVANAEGIVIAGEQVMPTPPRRRPPPPKRKHRGPGRGRKKRPIVAPGVEGAPAAPDQNGVKLDGAAATTDHLQVPDASSRAPSAGGDSTMQEGEEGSEDDDDEGDEGEEGEVSEVEGGTTPSRSPSKQATAPPEPQPLPTQSLTETPVPATIDGPPEQTTVPDAVSAALISSVPEIQVPTATPVSGDVEMSDAPPSESLPTIQTSAEEAPPVSLPTVDNLLSLSAAQTDPEPPASGILPPSELIMPQPDKINQTLPSPIQRPPTPPPQTLTQPLAPTLPPIDPVVEKLPQASNVEPLSTPLPTEPPIVEQPVTKILSPTVQATIPSKHNALEGLAEPTPVDTGAEDSKDIDTTLPPLPPVRVEPAIPDQASESTSVQPTSTLEPAWETAVTSGPEPDVALPPAIVEASMPVVAPVSTELPTTRQSPPPAPVPEPAELPASVSDTVAPSVPALATAIAPDPSRMDLKETASSVAPPHATEDTTLNHKPEDPKAGEETEQKPAAPNADSMTFPDGEENLLGTLEAHLEENP